MGATHPCRSAMRARHRSPGLALPQRQPGALSAWSQRSPGWHGRACPVEGLWPCEQSRELPNRAATW
eukprot:10145135-Alexandrium_andersonii.AAC.1